MSTRNNKGVWILLVEPLDLERVIHKSKRAVDTLQAAIGSVEIQASIDTIHPASIDTVQPKSTDTIQPTSIDTVQHTSIDTIHSPSIDTIHSPSIHTVHPTSIDTIHHNTVHHDTVHRDNVHPCTIHPDTVHPMKNDTTCGETEKIEVLILKLLDDIMAKRDEQHVFGELSRVHEAGTEEATSTLIDITTSTSIDVTTSSSIDDVDKEATMEDSLELEE
ncbi:hypothetical protein F2Q69_00013244 [Brassica cretica]|uniref:Uncharacterized protein n=1 Tax=Brassica cretica TaxID=69181 RepID=A0A8S9QY76_BRACR|nr:hypothetical protein F2Q69_00013244 [Brassica cretica]